MEYQLLGFSQRDSVRRFSFRRTAIGAKPLRFAVLVDITLAQKLKLPLQQLPSLCSRLLYACTDEHLAAALTLTETAMSIYASENETLAFEAAQSAKSVRARKQALLKAAAPSGAHDLCARAAAEAVGRERETTVVTVDAESINQLRARLSAAFRRFAAHDARVRGLNLRRPGEIEAELLLLAEAEREYLGLRLEYAERLGFPPLPPA